MPQCRPACTPNGIGEVLVTIEVLENNEKPTLSQRVSLSGKTNVLFQNTSPVRAR